MSPKRRAHPQTPDGLRVSKKTARSIRDLDPLVISVILGYLDVTSLHRFVFGCKWICCAENEILTHGLVIRSAVLSGDRSHDAMTKIYEYAVTKKTIYLPSPKRLLRLVNGRTCEMPGCTTKPIKIRAEFGIWACHNCCTNGRLATINQADADSMSPRAARKGCKIWKDPYVDSSGELAGPIFTHSLMKSSEEEREIFEKADDMISKVRLNSIIDCFHTAVADKQDRDRREALAKHKRKHKKWYQALETVRTFKQILGDDCPYRSVVCVHERVYGETHPIVFHWELLDGKLRALVSSSKPNHEKLNKEASDVRAIIKLIESTGFLSGSFLGESEWEASLKRYLQRHLGPQHIVEIRPSTIKLMERGMMMESLESFMSYSSCRLQYNADTSSKRYYQHAPWERFFAEEMARREIPENVSLEQAKHVARSVYFAALTREPCNFALFCTEAKARFERLLPTLKDLFNHFDMLDEGADDCAFRRLGLLSNEQLDRLEAREFAHLENVCFHLQSHLGRTADER